MFAWNARSAVVAVLFSSLGFAGVAQAGPVEDVCLKGGRPYAQCACAAEALYERMPERDFTLYEMGSDAYLLRSAAGLPDEDAWAAAIIEVSAETGLGEADVRARMQLAGALHRDAIRACR